MPKKKGVLSRAAVICLAAIFALALFPLVPPAHAAGSSLIKTVSYNQPAILATVGEAVNLKAYNVMFTESRLTPAGEISWQSTDLSLSGNTVTPTAKGVYKLTARASALERTVYLVVKAAADSEWVLYEQSFDSDPSLAELGYSVVESTDGAAVSVSGGKLVVAAQKTDHSYARVLLPAWLASFGDYRIEASVAFSNYQSASRWGSLMFRVQESVNYTPYYQMALRADTTTANGVELAMAKSKADNGSVSGTVWTIFSAKPYATSFSDGSYHTIAVDANGSTVATYIDGNEIYRSENMTHLYRGRMGFHTRSLTLSVDSVKVTLRGEQTGIPQIHKVASDIILPASILTRVNTLGDLYRVEAAALDPTTPLTAAVLRVDKELQVVSDNGTVMTSLEQAAYALHQSVIPAFHVSDAATVTALCAWLGTNAVKDVFILSENDTLIRQAIEAYPLCRGVLDLSTAEEINSLAGVREGTNAAGARVCVLPQALATKDNVEFLQRLLMTVWVESDTDTVPDLVRCITSGANGILTGDNALLASCYLDYFMPNTLVRTAAIIAHRGSPTLAQENTVEGALLAYELGATAIENDVYLTKDNVVVVMHDATIDGTTNGAGNVKDYTYEELCAFLVDDNDGVAPKPIPTLEDYFKVFKGKEVQLIVEIKDSDTAICEPLLRLINQYDIMDQVNVISFRTNVLLKLKELRPALSVGYLTTAGTGNTAMTDLVPTDSMQAMLSSVTTYASTYNPQYTTVGPNLIAAASHRGISILPWTINARADIDRFLLYGTHGITTDNVQYISSYITRVLTDKTAYGSAEENAKIPITVTTRSYDRTLTDVKRGVLTVLDADEGFSCSYDNGILKTVGKGSATLMLSVSATTALGTVYSVCSEPFTVTVDETFVEESVGESNQGGGGNNSSSSSPSPTSSGSSKTLSIVAICLSGTLLVANIAAAVTYFIVKKKHTAA